MAERDPERRPELLVGAGRRAREAGAVLAALATLEGGSETSASASASAAALSDFEELLAERAREGLLILEAGEVPSEDIGFVRRFLERNPLWRLAVVGEDPRDPRARALLALARARWLALDLAEPRALLAPLAWSEPRRPERAERRTARAAPPANGAFDLRALLEEVLAGAALLGEGASRYQLRAPPCPVRQDRSSLLEGLGGLVELARVCAGPDGLVRAALEPRGEALRIGIEFPSAGLPDGDLPALLERPSKATLEAPLSAGLSAARRGAELLRGIGWEVELTRVEPGRLRCELRFGAPPAAPKPARAVQAEDPFA